MSAIGHRGVDARRWRGVARLPSPGQSGDPIEAGLERVKATGSSVYRMLEGAVSTSVGLSGTAAAGTAG
jgi:hypothetical protein